MANQTQNTRQEIFYKEIDLIQSCISRMAQNSFMVKGWVITLVAACCAVSSLNSSEWKILFIFGGLAIILFWYLDAFFLKMERLYRFKYEWVIKNRMRKDEYAFDLNPYNKQMWETEKKDPSITKVMVSKTLCPMYLLLLAFDVFVFFYL
ncbi:MAG: hypothetical protein IJE43_23625 [Alphaproteobacteria bacterium]|nr:hypothetical protein [Alphaproteobacteria bacterium]